MDAGLAPVPLLASQILTRWLIRHALEPGQVLGADELEALGVVDNVPQTQRREQARWLLSLVTRRHTIGVEEPSHDEPRPLGAGDLAAVLDAARADVDRRQVRARPSRAQETSRRHVAAAIPQGSVRAASQVAFVDAVRAHPAFARLRRDAFRNVLAVAEHLALWAEWDTCTSRPTWDVLATRAGVTRRTVARVVARLRAAGLIGVVATGQSAHTATTRADQTGNLAAVYVLCVPGPVELVHQSVTPPTQGSVSETHPPHARAREANTPADPLRGPTHAATRSGPSPELVPDSPVRLTNHDPSPTDGQDKPGRRLGPVKGPLSFVPGDGPDRERAAEGPEHARTRRAQRAARLVVAKVLRERAWPLRALSVEDLAHVIADFVAAGWSAADLHQALDSLPDGRPHGHDGVPSSEPHRLRGWLTWRLSHWRGDDGAPLRSRSQRAAAEQQRNEALTRARRERSREERAHSGVGTASGRSAQILAKLRTDLARGNAEWNRRNEAP